MMQEPIVPPATYRVKIADRIKEILGEEEFGPETTLTYSWNHGYEKLEAQDDGKGKLIYTGAYHPLIYCMDSEGNSSETICMYCGRTLF